MAEIKLYVWQGPLVLKNYASGIVVVAAESIGMAWARLRAEQPNVWLRLSHGNHHTWVDTEEEVVWALAQEDFETQEGFPLAPDIYTPATLPVLHRTGGE